MATKWREERIGNQRLILGDCLEVLPTLEAGSVDAVVTDPPYGVTTHPWDELFRQEWLDAILSASVGPVIVCNAARPDVVSHMLQLKPTADRIIAWRQPTVTPSYGMFWTWQPIYCWRASFRGWDTVQFACVGKHGHPTEKPVGLLIHLLNMATENSDTVLDPFLGSGTTLVAAELLGRRGIGIEIDPQYFEVACRRVEQAAAQPRLFAPDAPPPAEQYSLEDALRN